MGGYGSGRQGGRVTIYSCGSCRLSTANLRVLLRSPSGGSCYLRYRVDDTVMTVDLEVLPHHGYLRLRHPTRAQTGPEHADYTIRLVTTPVGFGGHRWWFICPVSGQRCAVLWLPRGAYRFGSAKGYGLAYDITRLAPHDRLWHRMSKIARRLGDDDPHAGFSTAQAEMDAAGDLRAPARDVARRGRAARRHLRHQDRRLSGPWRTVTRMISENLRDHCHPKPPSIIVKGNLE